MPWNRKLRRQLTGILALLLWVSFTGTKANADVFNDTVVLADEELFGAASSLTPREIGDRVPLLLVHGIHGNELSCVEGSTDSINSPNKGYWSKFRNYLAAVSDLSTKYKLYHFHYVSDLYTVRDIADALGRRVSEKFGSRSIAIVAHSMGGLVARSFMEEHGGGDRVGLLITLGTPSRPGMGLAGRYLISSP